MKNDFIYILCPTNGYIPQLKMSGPVAHPLRVSRYTAKNMLMSGLKVFEFDKQTKQTVELTLQNIKYDNRFGQLSPEAIANNAADPVTLTESTGVSASTENIELPLNADGTVNESAINWKKYSSKQKKRLRAQIDEINAVKATENVSVDPIQEEVSAPDAEPTPVVEETPAEEPTSEPVPEEVPAE